MNATSTKTSSYRKDDAEMSGRGRPAQGGAGAGGRAADGRSQATSESVSRPSNPGGNRRFAGAAANANAVRERFGEVSDDAKQLATDTGRLARESLSPIEDIVKKHPFESALVAAGVGFLLGAILKSR